MDLGLKDKVALITGASRGIGAEIAYELAREGCTLVLTARSEDDLRHHAEQIRAQGPRVLTYAADLCQAGTANALITAAVTAFGRIDFVVANAGAARMGDFLELTDDDWQQGFALKFFGHVRLIRAAWPHLKAQHGGIVVIAGVAGRTPGATGLITGAVNSSLLSLTKGLAARGIADGVQVNAISPGAVRTSRFQARLSQSAASANLSEAEAERRMVADHGITRIGEPQDIAGMVSFILSSRGSLLQGALIDMDGGKTKTI